MNCGEQCGAWECIAEPLAEVGFLRGWMRIYLRIPGNFQLCACLNVYAEGGQTDKSRFLTSLAGCALWHRGISVGTNIYHHLSTVQLVQQYLNKRYLRCHRHSVVDVCVRQSAGYSRALGPSRTLKGAV